MVAGIEDVLLLGGGGHCKSVINAMTGTCFRPGAILDKNPTLDAILGIPVLGGDSLLPALRSRFDLAIVTVGQIKDYVLRWRLYCKLGEYGYTTPVIIAASANISEWASIGAGSTILNSAMINADVNIGENCIVNTMAIIEHDAKIGNNCHISTGAIINGGVMIADNVFVGSGAVIREGVKIENGSVIGIGSVVKKDVEAGSIIK